METAGVESAFLRLYAAGPGPDSAAAPPTRGAIVCDNCVAPFTLAYVFGAGVLLSVNVLVRLARLTAVFDSFER